MVRQLAENLRRNLIKILQSAIANPKEARGLSPLLGRGAGVGINFGLPIADLRQRDLFISKCF
jgi:hypothetical protein